MIKGRKRPHPPALLQGERRVMGFAYYPLVNGLSGQLVRSSTCYSQTELFLENCCLVDCKNRIALNACRLIVFGKLLLGDCKMRTAWHQHALTPGERKTLLCLRRTYGFPNPIRVYYNWLIGQSVRLSTR